MKWLALGLAAGLVALLWPRRARVVRYDPRVALPYLADEIQLSLDRALGRPV